MEELDGASLRLSSAVPPRMGSNPTMGSNLSPTSAPTPA